MEFPENYKYNKPEMGNRIIPESFNREIKITKDEYALGWGLDIYHYMKVQAERQKRGLSLRDDYIKTYDIRDGYDITGKKISYNPHKFHNMWIRNKKTEEKYHIDVISHHFQNGEYISAATRLDGSKSHGIHFIENISCQDPYIVHQIKEFKREYELIPKNKLERNF